MTANRWFTASCVLLLAAGCRGTPPQMPRDTIRMSTGSYLADAATFLAQDQGLFAAQDLDVRIELLNKSATSLQALAAGELDVAGSGPLNPRTFNVIQRGGKMRLVATRAHYAADGCAHDAFVVRNELLDSGRVTDAASLKGLRITTERTASNYYYFNKLLQQGGLTLDDVELVDMPPATRGGAFAKGLIDVSTATEPWTTRLVREGHVRVWKRVGEVLPDRHNTFILFSERLLRERRDLGVRFLAAYAEATRRLRVEGKSPRNVESIARWTKLDPAELRQMCWPQPPIDLRPDPHSLVEYQEWALANHLIDTISPYDQLVDTGFLDEIDGRPAAAR